MININVIPKVKIIIYLFLSFYFFIFNFSISKSQSNLFDDDVINSKFIGIVKIIKETKVSLDDGYNCGKKIQVNIIDKIKNNLDNHVDIWIYGDVTIGEKYVVMLLDSAETIEDRIKQYKPTSTGLIVSEDDLMIVNSINKCLEQMPKYTVNADGLSNFKLLIDKDEETTVFFKSHYLFLDSKITENKIVRIDQKTNYQFVTLECFFDLIKNILKRTKEETIFLQKNFRVKRVSTLFS